MLPSLLPPERLSKASRVLFLGAVTLSAWQGGLGSGLLATAGGALACTSLLTEPVHALSTPGRGSADLVVLVRGVVAEWEGTSSRHHLRLETDAEHLVGSVDPVRLERVLDNLVSKAIKYSPRAQQ